MAELLFFPVPLSVREEEEIEKACQELLENPVTPDLCGRDKFSVTYFDTDGQPERKAFKDLEYAREFYDLMCDEASDHELRMPVWVELK